MPGWVQVLVGMAALVTALGVLWTKALRPGARLISSTEEMLPLLRHLTATFKGSPEAFTVLGQIAAQFRTDSGSSLRDVVNRLERASEALGAGVEMDRRLDERDREQLARLLREVDRLTVKVDTNIAALAEIQMRAVDVATNLAVAQTAVDGVAYDLKAAHARADDTDGPAGAAADAAVAPATGRRRRSAP